MAAGFTKIHLDRSMACADDAEPLDGVPDALVFHRVRDTLEDYTVACKQKKGEVRI